MALFLVEVHVDLQQKLTAITALAICMVPLIAVLTFILCVAIESNRTLRRMVNKQDLQLEELNKTNNRCQALAETRRVRLITTERKMQSCPQCSSASQ